MTILLLAVSAVVAWAHVFVGFNLFYFTMLVLGMQGMPRRYYDHLPAFHTGHLVATVGSWIMVAGLLMMAANLVRGFFRKTEAPANPWGGVTLEWTVPSPPPVENFAEQPVITCAPYTFNPKDKAA